VAGLSAEPVAVLVLYVHPLLGRGLAQLLAVEPGLRVRAVPTDIGDVDEELAAEPDIVIFEDGGALRLEELLERTRCSVVVAISLASGYVWTLRRDPVIAPPDELVAAIVATCRQQHHRAALGPAVTTATAALRPAAESTASAKGG